MASFGASDTSETDTDTDALGIGRARGPAPAPALSPVPASPSFGMGDTTTDAEAETRQREEEKKRFRLSEAAKEREFRALARERGGAILEEIREEAVHLDEAYAKKIEGEAPWPGDAYLKRGGAHGGREL